MRSVQPSVAGRSPAGPLDACQGEIIRVLEVDGVPIGVYDVLLQDGRTIPNVPTLLPIASYVLQKGKSRHGGSGFLPIAQKGSQCVVLFLAAVVGHAQPFILGFFSPVQSTGGAQRNYRKLSPGSMSFITPYGNGLVLHNGGVVEMLAEPSCRRVMTPAGAETTDSRKALIADQCRNYQLQTAAGELTMTEIGGGKVRTKWRLREFSNFGNSSRRRAARGGGVERYVEIIYGSIENGDLYQERFSGSKTVSLACDGAGGYTRDADEFLVDRVASGLIEIRATADGLRTVQAQNAQYTIAGSVLWTSSVFIINAPLIALNGVVVIGGGGLPSARIGDLVLVGDHVGEIITGQPNLIH